MIHVVTLEPLEPELVDAVCRALFTGYGVGAEQTAELSLPKAAVVEGGLDAERLAQVAERVTTFADDKVLYLVARSFRARASVVGDLPTHGFADYGKERAVASAAAAIAGIEGIELQSQRFAKLALHQVGHLFGLHHCIDVKCAMVVPWGLNYVQSQTVELCSFCRDKSERRMKNAPT